MSAGSKLMAWLMLKEPRRANEQPLLILAALLSLLLAIWISQASYFAGFVMAQTWSRHIPPVLWECITVLGDERVLLALGIPFYRRYPQIFWAVLVSALLGALLSRGLKIAFPLTRPAGILPPDEILIIGIRITQHSFPSGHTISAFSFVGVWLAFLGRKYWVALLLLAGLAGFSRVAVGAHWPADVMVGAIIGLLSAWLGSKLARRLTWGESPAVQRTLLCLVFLADLSLLFDGQGYPNSLPFRVLVCSISLIAAYLLYLKPFLKAFRAPPASATKA